MSKIYSLSIENYRSIKKCCTTFNDNNLIVIIGRGDSGKSTILKAISCVLSPQWNLSFTDYDFYNCDTSKEICIEVILRDIPNVLLKDSKYGLYLGRLVDGTQISYNINDDMDKEYEAILTIQLKVDKTLEPKWYVLGGYNKENFIEISASDRAKFNMFMVSDYIDSHFSYGKSSPLLQLYKELNDEKLNVIEKIIDFSRDLHTKLRKLDYDNFKTVNDKVQVLAKSIGLSIEEVNSFLEFKDNVYSESNFSLHNNSNIPLKFLGKGTKRLLSIAIQLALAEAGGIILIDEIEQGLEPDRIRNIVRRLQATNNGQIFLTTHSRDVIVEAAVQDIFIKKQDELLKFEGIKEELDAFQGVLRAQPEAFFAKRVICCEGATELGIMRGIEDCLYEEKNETFALKGVIAVDCRGSSIFYKYARLFDSVGYDVCVFCDDDNKDIQKEKKHTQEKDIPIYCCQEGNAIEQQMFDDLPWDSILQLIGIVQDYDSKKVQDVPYKEEIFDLIDEEKRNEIRQKCAILAKGNKNRPAWYKNVDLGQEVGKVIYHGLKEMDDDCHLKQQITNIIKWINNDK